MAVAQETLQLVLQASDTMTPAVQRAQRSASSAFGVMQRAGGAATRALQVLGRTAQSVGRAAMGAFGMLANAARRVLAPITALFGTLAAGFTVVGIVRSVQVTIRELDRLQKTAAQTQSTVEEMSRLSIAFDIAGVQTDIGRAVTDFNRRVEQSEDALRRLGVATREANGEMRRGTRVFEEAVSALGRIDNAAEQARVGYELFGFSAREILKLANQNADALFEVASVLGEVSQESADAAASFNDARTILSAALMRIRADLVARFAPAVTQVIENIARVVAENRDRIVESISAGLSRVIDVVREFASRAVVAVAVVVTVAEEMALLARYVVQEWVDRFTVLLQFLDPALRRIVAFGMHLQAMVLDVVDRVTRALRTVPLQVEAMVLGIRRWLMEALNVVLGFGDQVRGTVSNVVADVIELVDGLRSRVINMVIDTVEQIGQAIDRLPAALVALSPPLQAAQLAFQRFGEETIGHLRAGDQAITDMATTAAQAARDFGEAFGSVDTGAAETAERLRELRREIVEQFDGKTVFGQLAETYRDAARVVMDEGIIPAFDQMIEMIVGEDSGLGRLFTAMEVTIATRSERIMESIDTLLSGSGFPSLRNMIASIGDAADDTSRRMDWMVDVMRNVPEAYKSWTAAGEELNRTMARGFVAVTQTMQNTIAQVLQGTASVRDVIRNMAQAFIQQLVQMVAQLAVTIPLLLLFNVLSGGALASAGAANTSVAISSIGGLFSALGNMGKGFASGIPSPPGAGGGGAAGPEASPRLAALPQGAAFAPPAGSPATMQQQPMSVQISYEINAVDARSVREMLMSEAGTISGIVSDRMENDMGFRRQVRSV